MDIGAADDLPNNNLNDQQQQQKRTALDTTATATATRYQQRLSVAWTTLVGHTAIMCAMRAVSRHFCTPTMWVASY
jgi:hypothetical protein